MDDDDDDDDDDDGGGDCNSTTKLLNFLKAIFTKKTSLSGSCLSSSRK